MSSSSSSVQTVPAAAAVAAAATIVDEKLIDLVDAGLELHHKRATVYALQAFIQHVSGKVLTLETVRTICWLNKKDYLLAWEAKETADSIPARGLGVVHIGSAVFVLEMRAKGWKKDARIKRTKEALTKCNHQLEMVDLPALDVLQPVSVPDGERQHAASTAETEASSKKPRSFKRSAIFDPDESLEYLQSQSFFTNQLVYQQKTLGKAGRFTDVSSILCSRVVSALRDKWNVSQLYEHQADAIKACLEGNHVLLLTGTGSGKTLCFAAVVAQRFAEARDLAKDVIATGGGFLPCEEEDLSSQRRKALFLYPTKALAQDQLRALSALFASEGIRIRAVDGDSTPSEREDARLHTDVLLTNPDFLHVTILPQAHSQWKAFVSNIALIVLDEAHTYNGAFGCHFSLVMRRHIRVIPQLPSFFMCSATISNPRETFFKLIGVREPIQMFAGESQEEQLNSSSSSTIAPYPSTPPPSACAAYADDDDVHVGGDNEEFTADPDGEFLSHRRLVIVSEDASPQGSRFTVIWRPPLLHSVGTEKVSEHQQGTLDPSDEAWELMERPAQQQQRPQDFRRTSPIFETARLLASLVRFGVRTLAFCKTRKLVELVLKYANVLLTPNNENGNDKDLRGLVVGYRAGYTKQERRDIERRMFSGELLGIACTSALELGIDIGTCECVLVLGLSGSASSIAQMFGRAGRKGKNALNIVVTFDGPLDRQCLKDPASFLARAKEQSAVFDPLNEVILKKHLLCAAKESSPLHLYGLDLDLFFNGNAAVAERYVAQQMIEDDLVCRCPSGNGGEGCFRLNAKVSKPHDFSLRVVESNQIRLVDCATTQCLDEIEYSRAFFELFPGAIYLHQSKTYCVLTLDLAMKKEALAKRVDVDYYTGAMDRLEVRIGQVFDSRARYVEPAKEGAIGPGNQRADSASEKEGACSSSSSAEAIGQALEGGSGHGAVSPEAQGVSSAARMEMTRPPTDPVTTEEEKDLLSTGVIRLTWEVNGFKKYRFQFEDLHELRKKEVHPVSLPPLEYST